jgi:hypothetical protein
MDEQRPWSCLLVGAIKRLGEGTEEYHEQSHCTAVSYMRFEPGISRM